MAARAAPADKGSDAQAAPPPAPQTSVAAPEAPAAEEMPAAPSDTAESCPEDGALDMVMDRELPEDERERIRGVIRRHAGVLGVHDLRTRASGPQIFIQCHIELAGDQTLLQAHAIADAVEQDLRHAFPGAEVIIHQDPYPAPDGPSTLC